MTTVHLDPMTTAQAGYFGRFLRAHLDYEAPNGGPATVVAKLAPLDEHLCAIGFDLGFFPREVAFYRELAASVPVRVPTCFFAALDPSTHRYVLLQEDLAAGRFGNQAHGCTAEEAVRLARELAKLHAWGMRWSRLGALEGITSFLPTFPGGFEAAFAPFAERYRGRVPEEGLAVAGRIGERIDQIYGALAALPPTVVHGDFRLDNVVFDLDPEGRPVLYDWQSNAAGPPGVDLGSLVALWSDPVTARALREHLLEVYRAELLAHGEAVHPGELRRGYELGLAHWFFRAVQTSMADSALDMADSLAVRATTALADVDPGRLLHLR